MEVQSDSILPFHVSRDVSKILAQGLKPGAEVSQHNEYFGMRGDPHYIYLWCEEITKTIAIFAAIGINPDITIRNTILLMIELDERTVERDYDQLFYLWRSVQQGHKNLKDLYIRAKGLSIAPEEWSEAGIRHGIDAVPNEQWKKRPGSYRIRHIDATADILPWNKMAPLWAQLAGYVTRPFFQWRNKK